MRLQGPVYTWTACRKRSLVMRDCIIRIKRSLYYKTTAVMRSSIYIRYYIWKSAVQSSLIETFQDLALSKRHLIMTCFFFFICKCPIRSVTSAYNHHIRWRTPEPSSYQFAIVWDDVNCLFEFSGNSSKVSLIVNIQKRLEYKWRKFDFLQAANSLTLEINENRKVLLYRSERHCKQTSTAKIERIKWSWRSFLRPLRRIREIL